MHAVGVVRHQQKLAAFSLPPHLVEGLKLLGHIGQNGKKGRRRGGAGNGDGKEEEEALLGF
jgi:hypothetical protein